MGAGKSIAIISDIHVGHRAAIWPDKLETETKAIIEASPSQKVILSYWRDFWGDPEVRSASYILNLAESIEGSNRKEAARGLMTADLNLQIKAFLQLIKPEIRGRKYLCVSGSQYHNSMDMDIEEIICQEIKGGTYAGHILNWEVKGTGRVINARHALSNAMIYKSTSMDRESLFLDAIEQKKFGTHFDMIVGAHLHKYFLVENSSRVVLLNPCWKAWHPIKGSKNYSIVYPSLGATLVKVGKRGVEVKRYTYPAQHVYDEMVKE